MPVQGRQSVYIKKRSIRQKAVCPVFYFLMENFSVLEERAAFFFILIENYLTPEESAKRILRKNGALRHSFLLFILQHADECCRLGRIALIQRHHAVYLTRGGQTEDDTGKYESKRDARGRNGDVA